MKENRRVPTQLLLRKVKLSLRQICSSVERLRLYIRKEKRPRLALTVLCFIALLVLAKPKTWWKQLRKAVIQTSPIKIGPCQLEYEYDSDNERDYRPYRFPTVEERIYMYMGPWYLPPTTLDPTCEGRIRFKKVNNGDQFYLVKELPLDNQTAIDNAAPLQRIFALDSTILAARMFFVNPRTLLRCSDAESKEQDKMMLYCADTKSTLLANLPNTTINYPLLAQFGDASVSKAQTSFSNKRLSSNPMVPHFKKFRRALPRSEVESFAQACVVKPAALLRNKNLMAQILQPIIWKLNIRRHYKKVGDVPCNDMTWNEKKDVAIFRGRMNGVLNKDEVLRSGMNDFEICHSIPRCRLAYRSHNSKTVDAKLTDLAGRIEGSVNGYNLTARALPMRQMLQHKAIIIVEGNDVSSGLKWALLSKSIVMMPQPRFTSWAMEERLEPWIHYVPLEDDLSNVEERFAWVLEHEAEAARIVKRATLWMLDLLYHPESVQDEAYIFKEILARYARHFVWDDSLQI